MEHLNAISYLLVGLKKKNCALKNFLAIAAKLYEKSCLVLKRQARCVTGCLFRLKGRVHKIWVLIIAGTDIIGWMSVKIISNQGVISTTGTINISPLQLFCLV